MNRAKSSSSPIPKKKEDGTSNGGGSTIALIEATPDTIWQHLRDWETHADFFPRLTRVEKYKGDKTEDIIGLDCTLKVAFKKVRYYVVQTFDKEHWTMNWMLDDEQKNDIKYTRGSWILVPHGEDKTIALYTLYTNTGIAIPKFIERFLLKRDLPNVVESLKLRVESGGEYTKKD